MVVLDLLHQIEIGLVVHVPVPLLPVHLVVLLLLLLQVLRLQQLLEVGALGLDPPQSPVPLLQLAQLLDLEQVVPPRPDDGDELLGADDGGGPLHPGQAYIYSALL